MALCQAGEHIASGAAGFVLVGGIDRFIEPGSLTPLETAGRVLAASMPNSYSPAEEAAFHCCWVTRPAAARRPRGAHGRRHRA